MAVFVCAHIAPAGTPGDDQDTTAEWNDVSAGTPRDDLAAESPRPLDGWAARQADALVALAETVVADGLRPGSGPNRHTVIIHTAATTDGTDTGGYGDHGGRLSPETVRRLMCDASLTFALDGPDGKTVNVTPRTPSIPSALARAVKRRDGACVFPGCTRQAFTDLHHLQHRGRRRRKQPHQPRLPVPCPSPHDPRRRLPHHHRWSGRLPVPSP